MNNATLKTLWLCLFVIAISCNNTDEHDDTPQDKAHAKGSYAYDSDFLKKHTQKVLELISDDSTSKILLSADYQGRVMTSTASGDTGLSFGWLNYDLISAPQKKKQFNPVGGEERFWLGPEGGQYSIYFKARDSFNFNNWQVPPLIDTVSYDVIQSNNTSAVFSKAASITNYSGTIFNVKIDRKISMLNKTDIETRLSTSLAADIKSVGYQTDNTLQNVGTTDWSKDKGLLSIWLLGMFTPSPTTTVIIPFSPIVAARSFITDNYFGAIPQERLMVKDSVLYFVCDGKYRSKIGLSPRIAKPMAASYDFQNNVLTIVIPQVSKNAQYVNSKWEIQEEPYKGDVINSYNDGPLEDGSQMGPFYEIESSSPALELQRNESATYSQATIHLQGSHNSLHQLVKNVLNVDLDEIKKITMHLYKTVKGAILHVDDKYYLFSSNWDTLINQADLYRHLLQEINGGESITKIIAEDYIKSDLLPPVGSQEVWAAGVTYLRSLDARKDEAKDAGAADCYQRVYEAERPELFFKSLPHRVVGHGGKVNIRRDSAWNVPEPELTLYINSNGKIQAYTIGNDMSSRSIEGENPLYLPQAKVYERSAALGPCLYIIKDEISPETKIYLKILRHGNTMYEAHTPISRMKRSLHELAVYLFSECNFSTGVFLMTGTCLVPPDNFTLEKDDEVVITIDGIGTLFNTVALKEKT